MKKIIFLFTVLILVFLFSGVSHALDQEEIEGLIQFAVTHKPPQQGLYGGAMWVLGARTSLGDSSDGGYCNIFFRVHEGGNRAFVTMFYKTVVQTSATAIAVESFKFQDGGSVLGNDDELGSPEGNPDKVTVQYFREGDIESGDPGKIGEEKETPLTQDLLELWEEGIRLIKKANKLFYEPSDPDGNSAYKKLEPKI